MAAFAALYSCGKVDNGEIQKEPQESFVIHASIESDKTKSSINDETLSITWDSGDEIDVFFNSESHMFSTTESGKSVSFTSLDDVTAPGPGTYMWGVYPHDSGNSFNGTSVTVTLPNEQEAFEDSFAPGLCIQIAKSEDFSMSFMNVCSFVRFSVAASDISRVTLSGNNGEIIAGQARVGMVTTPQVSEFLDGETQVVMNAPVGECFTPGKSYYFVVYPQDFSNGITISYEKTDGSTGSYQTVAYNLERRYRANIMNRDNGLTFTLPCIDLSASGTANCYIVPQAGNYKFKATQGNLSAAIPTISSVEVLWESFGTNVKPSVGDLIQASVSYEDDYVFFSTNNVYKEGNAVIAAKNSSGTILWSWHIWMTEDVIAEHVYNRSAGTFMDRNLGATSATPGEVGALGLLYEWGRKDPFLGSSSISAANMAESTIDWPAIRDRSSKSETLPISYSIEHPTTYISSTAGYYNQDWTSEDYKSFTRWQVNKTKYDPCPAGWRVPGSSDGSPWTKSLGTDWYADIHATWDSENLGIDFAIGNLFGSGCIWYPATSLRNDATGTLDLTGHGFYWTVNKKTAFFPAILDIHHEDDGYYVYNGYSGIMTTGASVRCVKE